MRGGESFGERILREMLENITGKETYMDTKDFDARNEEKSRSVCERIHVEHAGRELTERERRILDMWPKFEDGAPLMYEDEFQLGGEVHTAYGFNFGVYGRVSIGVEQGSHVRLPNGERVKRPEPKVLDADGVEIHVGDTVRELETGEEYKVERVFSGTTDPDFPGHAIRCNKVADPITHAFKPDQLTHTRRDSWERLEEDTMKSSCAYFGFASKPCSDGDGCPANKPGDCAKFKAVDIVRRAKALAGVEVDA